MRPYFFKRPTITEDRRAMRFRENSQRPASAKRSKPGRFRTAIRAIVQALRSKTPADLSALALAEAKRERRRVRNIAWWSRDATWRRG